MQGRKIAILFRAALLLALASAFNSRRTRCVHPLPVRNCLPSYPFLYKTTTTTLPASPQAEVSAGQNQTSSSLLLLSNPKTNDTGSGSVLALQEQAAALRAEIATIESDLRASQEAKRQKELADIDQWIEECLYVSVHNNNNNADDTTTTTRIELLNSVDKAAQVLRDNRYSHEQVSKMFERICDTSPAQSRSNCSPLLALLVDAAGKLDCVEREDNPNKRWDGKVERDLRKRLFAMDWRITLEPFHDKNDRFL